MVISGEGITQFNCQIQRDFTIETTLALSFFDLANGGNGVIDRTAEEDLYESSIVITGKESDITLFLTQLSSNRTSGDNILQLSGFNKAEKIFGADIDYSQTIECTAIIDRREQRTKNTWSVGLKLVAHNLSFITTPYNSDFPNLNFIVTGYDADYDNSINKMLSLNNTFQIIDHDSDKGTWSGMVQVSQNNMVRLRSFARINRGNNFSIPILNRVTNPFNFNF